MPSSSQQTDLSPQALAHIKTVAIWGASRSGVACLPQLKQQNIAVLTFIDKDADLVAEVAGIPVLASTAIKGSPEFLHEVDAVILAMGADSTVPRQMLLEAGFSKPVIPFLDGASVEKIFKGQFSVNHLFKYDHGEGDRLLLESLFGSLPDLNKTVIYGAGKLTRYAFEMLEGLSEKVAATIDDNADNQSASIPNVEVIAPEKLTTLPETVFLASTKYLTIEQLRKRAKRLFGEAPTLRVVEEIKELLDPVDIPRSAWRPPENTIYPIDIPEIEFEKNRDVILLDFPARFLGMMPNGLGACPRIEDLLRKSPFGPFLRSFSLNMNNYLP